MLRFLLAGFGLLQLLLPLAHGQACNTTCAVPIPACSTSASAVTVPPTWMSLTFSNDPRPSAGGASSADYGWLQSVDTNAAQATLHQGILSLGGGPGTANALPTNGPFVNLSTTSGPNTIGMVLPSNIGGSGPGSASMGTAGWSFELVFQPTLQQVWAKIFDIGNPQINGICRDDLLFGWNGGSMQWTFTYCDSNGFQYTIFSPFTSQLGYWYHVVVSMQQLLDSNGNPSNFANYYMFINGTSGLGQGGGGPLPSNVFRANADLGRSDWYDSYYQGYLDSFSIYNYALNQQQAQALYLQKMAGCSVTTGTPTGSAPTTPSTSTASPPTPLWSLPTNTAPAMAGQGGFGWVQQDSADASCGSTQQYHQGLITLAGNENQNVVGQFLNISATSGLNSVSTPLPMIGGSSGLSIEYMVKPGIIDTWAKLFDFGTYPGPCVNDVVGGWVQSLPMISFSTCDSRGNQWAINYGVQPLYLNTWVHVVNVIQPNADGTGNYYTYVNGALSGAEAWALLPIATARADSYIGKSGWQDTYWAGEIDFFNVYGSAVSGPQVAALYSAAGGSAATAYCPPSSSGAPPNTLQMSNQILSLTFSTDPRTYAGGPGVADFGWVNVDSNDTAAAQALHQGLLVLAGGPGNSNPPGNYVNLSSTSGPNYVGYTMDPMALGGPSAGNLMAGTFGWTIELVFKATGPQTWAKLIDFGGGAAHNDILFGQWQGFPNSMTFQTCDTEGNCFGMNPVGNLNAPSWWTGPVQNVWNHAVLVIQEGATGQGNYFVYINGTMIASMVNNVNSYYPQELPRPNGFIGRSDWGDAYWQGELDSLRIWNVAASSLQATNLWLANQGQPLQGSGGGGSSLSNGAIAGIVIGSVVGAALILLVCLFLLCGGSRSKSSSNSGSRKMDGVELSHGSEMSTNA